MSEAILSTPKPQNDYIGVDEEPIPTTTSKFGVIKNQHLRECVAEFFGTMIMILFGMAVNSQVTLSKDAKGSFLSINLAWGIGVMLGVHATEGVSGAHLNSCVTFAQAVHGNLPWWKVPGYIISQVLGAFVGAVMIFWLHKPNLDAADPERTYTRQIFATYPSEHISHLTAFYTEALGSAILVLGVFCITDQKNRPASPFATPIHFALLIAAIGMSFGMNTGYAINPARDFGPRVMTWICGWGSEVWTHSNYYFWVPIVAPCVGATLGGYAYKIFISNHHPQNQVLPM